MDFPGASAVFLVGILVGFINTLAGGGSLISLPLLIFLGLPPTLANGTNRLAILVQSAVASWSFYRAGAIPWRLTLILGAPALVGAWFGVGLALDVDPEVFRRILAVLLVISTVFFLRRRPPNPKSRPLWLLLPLFLGVGVYGGFLQAGVGILILLTAVGLAGLDVVRANAMKSVIVTSYTIIALALFVRGGQVHWGFASVLALGNMIGAFAGVRLAVTQGNRWVQYVVAGVLAIMGLLLWFGGGNS